MNEMQIYATIESGSIAIAASRLDLLLDLMAGGRLCFTSAIGMVLLDNDWCYCGKASPEAVLQKLRKQTARITILMW